MKGFYSYEGSTAIFSINLIFFITIPYLQYAAAYSTSSMHGWTPKMREAYSTFDKGISKTLLSEKEPLLVSGDADKTFVHSKEAIHKAKKIP